jgi:hypothetical protein
MSTTRPVQNMGSVLGSEASMAISSMVELAQQQLIQRKLCLTQTREQLQHLDSQIADFLADKSVPGRNAGIFLCRMAMHLRGIANELDGRTE